MTSGQTGIETPYTIGSGPKDHTEHIFITRRPIREYFVTSSKLCAYQAAPVRQYIMNGGTIPHTIQVHPQ